MDLFQVDADGGVTVIIDAASTGAGGFQGLSRVATGPTGDDIFVAGLSNQVLKVVGSDAVLVAGDGAGSCDDTQSDGGGGFMVVPSMAVDAQGNIYVPDQGPEETLQCTRIQKVAPDGSISTVAGVGATGYQDGPGAQAEFWAPSGIAVDQAGNLYVADSNNERIRKVAPDGTTTTLSGNGNPGFHDGTGGALGTATFNNPISVAVDANGFVYVADNENNSIRRVAPDGTTITLTGNGSRGAVDGTLAQAEFNAPNGVAVGQNGDVYVADTGNCRLRVIHLTP